jgi:uracil-DNA glycosylase family 4
MASIGNKYVPSEGNPDANLWIIGEAPGETEEFLGRPFVGNSGEKLDQVLGRAGINRKDVFLTNLCHYKPIANKFETVRGTSQLQEGLDELRLLLQNHKPNVIATLGNWPTYFLTNKTRISKKGIIGIGDWRGSILQYDPTHLGELNRVQKVIPTYHPSFVLRNPAGFVAFDLDIKRIVSDSQFPELNLPQYNIQIDPPNLEEYVERLLQLPYTASDIENVTGTAIVLCIGFSLSDTECVVITLGEAPSLRNRDAVQRILAGNVGKVFHYGMHDTNVLQCAGYTINNYSGDTIVQAHVLAPELPRDLAFLTSLLTRQPFYKDDGKQLFGGDAKSWSLKRAQRKLNDLCVYNGKDVCVTHSIYDTQLADLEKEGRSNYYSYRMELTHALLEIGNNGLYRDPKRTAIFRSSVRYERNKCAIFLCTLAGYKIRNIANKEMCKLLYDTLKLPKRYKTDRGTGKQSLTTDEDALIGLLTYCNGHIEKLKTDSARREWGKKREVIKLVLKIRGLSKLNESYFSVPVYSDGICRTIYKSAATETGRCANVKYVDKSGLNIQTTPRAKLEVPQHIVDDVEKELNGNQV